jgi:hypothetical protein
MRKKNGLPIFLTIILVGAIINPITVSKENDSNKLEINIITTETQIQLSIIFPKILSSIRQLGNQEFAFLVIKQH